MRYYFVIFLAERSFYRKAKGRFKNSRFFQTLAKMGFFFIFGLDLGGGQGKLPFFLKSPKVFMPFLPFRELNIKIIK